MINPNDIQKKDEVMPVEPENMVRVDLACGENKADGWLGIDKFKTSKTDVVHDLMTYPWPFKDESVDEARCSHFFEHLEPAERISFMNELSRVLKKGAGCTFITPKGFDRQVQDPTHKWPPISLGSWYYFDPSWLKSQGLEHYVKWLGLKCDFEVRPISMSVSQEFSGRSEEQKIFAMNHYMNAGLDLIVVMVKR